MNEYTAILKKSGAWWIGWIAEVPGVNCQERTREALIDTLRATLKEALEFNRQDARAAAGRAYEEEPIGEWQRPDMSANDMKKPSSPKRSEDLRPEYGASFSAGCEGTDSPRRWKVKSLSLYSILMWQRFLAPPKP